MQLFIGRVPSSISYDELYDYFSKFGKINELRLKESYGFLRYEQDSVAEKVVEEKHKINEFEIHVEAASNGRKFQGADYRPRSPPRYHPQSPVYRPGPRDMRYRPRSPERMRGRSPPYAPDWARKRYRSPTPERSPCDYCDRCERHGRYGRGYRDVFSKREKRNMDYGGPGRFSSQMKIVLDNIGENVGQRDLFDFVERYNLKPTFTKVTASGNHGIVEFGTVEEKEDALNKLNGVEFMGRVVSARPYFQRERGFSREPRYRRPAGENTQPSSIYDDIKTGEDWPKNPQNEGEWQGGASSWTDTKEGEKPEL